MSVADRFLEALQEHAGGDETAVVDAEAVGDTLGMNREEVRRQVQALASRGMVEDTTGAGETVSVRILREGTPGAP